MASWKNKLLKSTLILMFVILGACSGKPKGELVYVTANEIAMKIANEETFVFYVGTTSCSFCIKYKPELEKIIESNPITIYGVMVNEGNEEDNQALMERLEVTGTPQTYWFRDGKLVSNLSGYVDAKTVKKWLKENEVLEELNQ